MKILLDENLPQRLVDDFPSHFELHTVGSMGWQGTKNGELLALITANHFDVFVTLDKNLRHQQNLSKHNFTIFLLLSVNNRLGTLQPLIQTIVQQLQENRFEKFNEIS